MNRMKSGVKIWLSELAILENGNANRIREEKNLLNCNFLLKSGGAFPFTTMFIH